MVAKMHNNGFSLLELLIAITLGAILLGKVRISGEILLG
jgi:prepilin-type N-terminal cleavage/methylation domain-containing protein